jgi:hypothetical protein
VQSKRQQKEARDEDSTREHSGSAEGLLPKGEARKTESDNLFKHERKQTNLHHMDGRTTSLHNRPERNQCSSLL